MNVVVISGRLTKKPELRSTQSGTEVSQFTLAVDRNKVDKEGNREVDFIECVCFGRTAENLCKYQDKGSMIEVKGRIQIDGYTNNEGKKAYRTMIYADMINYINSPKTVAYESKNDEKDAYKEFGSRVANDRYELPF